MSGPPIETRLQEETYWRQRWEANQTQWQLEAPNTLLVEYFNLVAPAPERSLDRAQRTVFVPLSGKTLDIHWLRGQGYSVIGCEISEKAVGELFTEMGVEPRIYQEHDKFSGKDLTVWEHGKVKIYVANIFDLGVINVDAVYDRAALVALPADTREKYTEHVTLITKLAPQLLIAFEHSRPTAPPHSIPLELIQKYYGDVYDVEPVARKLFTSELIEAVYVLTPKQDPGAPRI